eukprot:3958734-Amphidinium_carterae.1
MWKTQLLKWNSKAILGFSFFPTRPVNTLLIIKQLLQLRKTVPNDSIAWNAHKDAKSRLWTICSRVDPSGCDAGNANTKRNDVPKLHIHLHRSPTQRPIRTRAVPVRLDLTVPS